MIVRSVPALRLTVLAAVASLLVAGCARDTGGERPQSTASNPDTLSGPVAGRSDAGSAASAADTPDSSTAADTVPEPVVAVTGDGLLVDRAYDFSLRLPPGITSGGSSPDGLSFVLDRNGEHLFHASVEGVRTVYLESMEPGEDPSWAVAVRRATDL